MALKSGFYIILLPLLAGISLSAQNSLPAIREGNKLYEKGEFEKSLQQFRQAAGTDPDNPILQYNLGNAAFRQKDFAAAEAAYDAALQHSSLPALKQKAYYNKGVACIQQKKLDEAIEALKQAVILNPADEDARFNLQKALEEKRKQKQPDQQDQKKKQQPQNNKEQPRRQQPNKRMLDQWLQALRQKEQEVQKKMQDNRNRAAKQPEKDW